MPPPAVSVVPDPAQTDTAAGLIVAVGRGLTVTVVDATALQLLASVTVTEYAVAADGDTAIAAVISVVLQAYAVPPDAVRVMLLPLHTAGEAGLMPGTGSGFTETVAVALAVQLLASVTVAL